MAPPAHWEEIMDQSVSVSQLQQAGGQRRVRFPQLLSHTAECQKAWSRTLTPSSDLATQLLPSCLQRHPPGQRPGTAFSGTSPLFLQVPATKTPEPGKAHMKSMSIEQTSKLRPNVYFLNSMRPLTPIFMGKGSH